MNATPEQAQAGIEGLAGDITGCSILETGSRAELDELLAGHPHRHTPGAAIDAYECQALPGM